jgi:hypothetical protein
VICEWCGCFFCQDRVKDHEVFSRDVKMYCTRTCGNEAKRARARARKRGEPLPASQASVMASATPCPTGKIRYPTEQAAEEAVRALRNKLKGTGLHVTPEEVRPHECPECRDWHYDRGTAFFAPPPSTRFIRDPKDDRSRHPRRQASRWA